MFILCSFQNLLVRTMIGIFYLFLIHCPHYKRVNVITPETLSLDTLLALLQDHSFTIVNSP